MNSTYKIVSYLSNKHGTEKTSLIYDTINKRIIEKWISYQLVNDKSKFVITNRYTYVYNKFNIINRILEVEKGSDDRDYSFLTDNNEYCHSFNRTVCILESNFDRTVTQVIYSRNNHIGSKEKNWFIKSLNLLTKEVNGIYKTRINYLLKRGRLYIYEYKQNDFFFLNKIVEYKVLIDLRFINRLISESIGKPVVFINESYLILKVKIKEDFVNDNEEKSIYEGELDYFSDRSLYSMESNFVHNLIFIEDLFINEKSNLDKMYGTLK